MSLVVSSLPGLITSSVPLSLDAPTSTTQSVQRSVTPSSPGPDVRTSSLPGLASGSSPSSSETTTTTTTNRIVSITPTSARPTIYKDARLDHSGTSPAGALITAFSFPTDCVPSDLDPTALVSSCAPPNFDEYWTKAGYYSPAVCPQDYTVCSSRWHSSQGPSLQGEESAWMCAPTGYSCVPGEISFAVSSTARSPMIQIRFVEADGCVVTPSAGHEELVSGSAPIGSGCFGYKTDVVFVDLEGTSTAVGPAATGVGAEGIGRVSGGAIAGIVVGTIVGLAMLVVLGFCAVRRRWRSKDGVMVGDESVAEMGEGGSVTEMGESRKDYAEMDARSVISEKKSSSLNDGLVGTEEQPAELDGGGIAHTDLEARELPSDAEPGMNTASTATSTTKTATPHSAFAITPISPSTNTPETISLPISPLSPDDPEPGELSARTPALAAAMMAASEKFLAGQNPLLMAPNGASNSPTLKGGSDGQRAHDADADEGLDELAALRIRSERLQASKMRLLELQRIDEEHAAVQRQIEQLEMEREKERRSGNG